MGQDGQYFREYMSDCIRKKYKTKVSVHHIYLDLVHNDNPAKSLFGGGDAFVGHVLGFEPDILLINDDLALDYIASEYDTLLNTQPCVFAGVSAQNERLRNDYPLLTGFEDRVNLAANCEIFHKLTGCSNPTVEIDFSDFDNRLRADLYSSISDTSRFVNNGDFHMKGLSEEYLQEHGYAGKIVVNFVSMGDRKSNRMAGSDEQSGLDNTASLMAYASLSYEMQIQVKYDIFSNELIDCTPTPQMTCIREQFGFEPPLFLCGYLTSVETQIEDQLDYAFQILNGHNPERMPVLAHSKDKYMDWNAMRLMNPPYEYKDYCDEYIILNAPFNVRYHFVFLLLVVLSVLILFFVAISFSIVRIRKNNEEKNSILNQIKTETSKRRIALGGKQSAFIVVSREKIQFFSSNLPVLEMSPLEYSLGDFRNRIGTESLKSYEILVGFANSDAENGRIRLCCELDGKGMHWWDVFFCHDELKKDDTIGIAINIDSVVEYENSVQQSMDRAVEISAKQNFLANITHDIRTPLNAIAGFAQLLAEGCTDEERVEYSEIISMNTEHLLNLIDSAVKMPADSTEIMSIRTREIDMSKLVSDSYRTNRILKPAHLEFIFNPGEPLPDGKATVNADPVRTSQVINNFVSNAFKYTPEGSVTLGWLIPDGRSIEVFVSDTGVGISEEDGKIIHERYSMAHDNNRGTGLGLDICRTIVEKQNGEYGFSSKVGEGSRFWFRMPLINATTDTAL